MSAAFTALVNPIAGGGAAMRRWSEVADHLGPDADVEIVLTRDREHAVTSAHKAADAGRVVVAVGGDGLVRDVATGVVAGDGVMAIVPSGRGNDFVQSLGLPGDPSGIASVLTRGVERRLDVLEANGVCVPGNVYAGLDSLSTVIINRNRWLPARVLYRLAPYLALARWRPAAFTLVTDRNDPITLRAHIVVIGNSGRYGHGLQIVPSAVPDDGRIDVLVVGALPKYRLGSFLRDAQAGTHANWSDVTVLTGSTITLSADAAVPVCADGDELGQLPVTVELRAGALRLLTPSP